MKLGILAVGQKLPDWVAKGCAEYVKRMPRELPLCVVDIKPEPRAGKSREQLLGAERTRLLAALQPYARVVVLDERGSDLSTLQLAPGELVQAPVNAIFPGVDAATLGHFTLHARAAGSSLFTYGSVIDNASGDPVFFGGR